MRKMTASLERVGREMAMSVYVDIYQMFDRYLTDISPLSSGNLSNQARPTFRTAKVLELNGLALQILNT
jgi:hypothetical protein